LNTWIDEAKLIKENHCPDNNYKNKGRQNHEHISGLSTVSEQRKSIHSDPIGTFLIPAMVVNG
jgi:hypothetical protein